MIDETTSRQGQTHGDTCRCTECLVEIYTAIQHATDERKAADKDYEAFQRQLVLTLRDASQHHAADRLEYLIDEQERTAHQWEELKAKHPREMQVYVTAITSGTIGQLIASILRKP
jgi:hypothetical protein